MPILLVILSIPAAISIPLIIYRFARRPQTPLPSGTSTPATVSTSSSAPRTPTPAMSPTEEGAMVWQTTSTGRSRNDSDSSEEYVRFGTRVKTGLREKLGLGI